MQSFLIALCRITVGGMFLVFGSSKIFQPTAFGGKSFVEFFPGFVQEAVTTGHPYFFWKPVLESVVLPNAALFAWAVAVGEFLLGISLVLGWFTRLSAFFGFLLLASIHFCKNPFATAGPFWSQVGGTLEQLPLALLLVVFVATSAGQTLGLDGLKKRAKAKAMEKEKVAV